MTEKMKRAVALKYEENIHSAPIITAKGKGIVADKIIDAAKEHGVPIYEDSKLVEMLDQINLNEMIPENLFQAVAEVFAFIYRLDEAAGKKERREENPSTFG